MRSGGRLSSALSELELDAPVAAVGDLVVARENNPGHATGVALGFVNTVNIASGAVFQPLIGLLLDLGWEGAIEARARIYSAAAYDVALGVLPASFAISVLLALMIRETWCRPID